MYIAHTEVSRKFFDQPHTSFCLKKKRENRVFMNRFGKHGMHAAYTKVSTKLILINLILFKNDGYLKIYISHKKHIYETNFLKHECI